MLCNRCNERIATVHLTMISRDKTVKQDFCGICSKEFVDPALYRAGEGGFKVPIIDEPVQVFKSLAKADPRYTVHAYDFVCDGMSHAKRKRYGSACKPEHISGAELLESLRELALETYGTNARATLNSWGIFPVRRFRRNPVQSDRGGIGGPATDGFKGGFSRRV
ncbi:MAG TPA: Minf_1886 family protein [Candidatus Acidoferrales bacterium]|jgi:hypothetical protein|nr:Minf_1886 family protein [Candidatus Acidoferrales bacterium]